MPNGTIADAKAALRQAALARRASFSPRGAGEAVAAALDDPRLAAELARSAAVAAYWPIGDEFDTRPLIERLLAAGAVVGLPVVDAPGGPLRFRRYQPGMILVPAGHGTLAPPPDAPLVSPQVVFAPLLAADRRGFRLGYGGGYYDRTLAALRASGPCLAIGLCYQAQLVAEVPAEAGDERLDWILTETELIRCNWSGD
ncbi:MAG: 5-formyltetrahydrofolate cyclo-ligase [Alphaproteobacteria bacterium]|nr:5-formyltetrahydrofolate cyclo-ligase [Alphaproteobacteria bacterium]